MPMRAVSTRTVSTVAALTTAALAALPARAEQTSFAVDYPDCLSAQAQAAAQLKVPLAYSVLNADRRDFVIATSGGTVTMICDRKAGTLTVVTPPGQSILPYISVQ
jgi:hypothetical protein